MSNLHWPQVASPWIMGILNVTPDSFSDGGQFHGLGRAVEHVRRMVDEGAHIIDIGGESTRPGTARVDSHEQISRVVPIVTAVRKFWWGPISIDTTSSVVARAALDAGASWINDISALREDPFLAGLIAERDCPVVLMHMQGTPRTMQDHPTYENVVGEVCAFLRERAEFAETVGIDRGDIIVDPGIGFGKTLEHNLALLNRLSELVALGYPVLVGASRKSFIGMITGAPVDDRLAGSLAAAVSAVREGAKIVRVHDVGPTRQALAVAAALTSH